MLSHNSSSFQKEYEKDNFIEPNTLLKCWKNIKMIS